MATTIEQQALRHLMPLLLNQARYNISPSWLAANVPVEHHSRMFDEVAEGMTNMQTAKLLNVEINGAFTETKLLALIEEMTLVELFDDDGWVDPIANYIDQNKAHFEGLWEIMRHKLMQTIVAF